MQYSAQYQFYLPDAADAADIGDLNANFTNVDTLLTQVNAKAAKLETEKLSHTEMTVHCTAQNPHSVTAAQTGAYTKTQADTAVAEYVESRMIAVGNGDMLKSVYDADGDGMVDKAKNAETHSANKQNPHGVTKAQIGLANVENTADSTKNVAYATRAGSLDGGTY
ncbi:MAG: hypothetical protein RSD54_04765 [Ruthenibacterium sp.]